MTISSNDQNGSKYTTQLNSPSSILTDLGCYPVLKDHELKKYDWQKPHQHNLTGTNESYYPYKNKDVFKKKYKSWKN